MGQHCNFSASAHQGSASPLVVFAQREPVYVPETEVRFWSGAAELVLLAEVRLLAEVGVLVDIEVLVAAAM